MDLTRRSALALSAGAMIAAVLPVPVFAAVEDTIAEFTGGAETVEGALALDAPEIAENGNTVPVSVSAPGAVAILIIATGNPLPPVATFNFGPLAAKQEASTRMRLAETQDVIAIAKMSDGTFLRTTRTIKVTIGGCGG